MTKLRNPALGKLKLPPASDTQRSRLSTLVSTTLSPAVLALTLGLVAPAEAELVTKPNLPAFSAADQAIIARNETLKAAVESEPWLVYRLLRDMDVSEHGTQDGHGTPDGLAGQAPLPHVDPARDPDLDAVPRASAEAAKDLFSLIKNAGSTRPK